MYLNFENCSSPPLLKFLDPPLSTTVGVGFYLSINIMLNVRTCAPPNSGRGTTAFGGRHVVQRRRRLTVGARRGRRGRRTQDGRRHRWRGYRHVAGGRGRTAPA